MFKWKKVMPKSVIVIIEQVVSFVVLCKVNKLEKNIDLIHVKITKQKLTLHYFSVQNVRHSLYRHRQPTN